MTASAFPRRLRPITGSSAATMVLDLSTRSTIDPDEAAAILDLPIVMVEQVTMHRRKYHLGSSYLWIDAAAIVGGVNDTWRMLDLGPRDLSLAAFRLDPPHEIRPHLAQTEQGTVVAALEHVFKVRAGTLCVRTVRQSMRIERIALTTDDSKNLARSMG